MAEAAVHADPKQDPAKHAQSEPSKSKSDKAIENRPMVYVDIFNPTLKEVPPGSEPGQELKLTAEQDMYVKAVLEKTSSDNQMAEKAYKALKVILGGGAKPPEPDPQDKPVQHPDPSVPAHATPAKK